MVETRRITVFGKVQGVYFRQSTKECASRLGLNGTVKNLPDGRVEVIASGGQEQLEQLAEWCKKGPSQAEVTHIQYETVPTQHFDGFKVVRN